MGIMLDSCLFLSGKVVFNFSNPEQGGAPPRGAGPQHQEPGLLAQTHHADRLHHRGGQELLHTCAQSVSRLFYIYS